eukprot:992-Heterococcus_DN1.PRE.2
MSVNQCASEQGRYTNVALKEHSVMDMRVVHDRALLLSLVPKLTCAFRTADHLQLADTYQLCARHYQSAA